MRETESETGLAPGHPARASVAADMEAIFGDPASHPRPVRQPVVQTALVAPPPARAGTHRAALVGALLLATSGAVIGLASWRGEHPAHVAMTAIPLAPPRPLPKPNAASAASREPVTPPAAVAAVSAPPLGAEQGATRLVPVRAPASGRTRSERRPASDVDRQGLRFGERDQGRADGPGPCRGLRGGDRYACTLDALAAADGRLRRAYDTAVVTGMPRRDLLAVRERWSFLRRDADRRPFWVIARYRALADELDATNSRAR